LEGGTTTLLEKIPVFAGGVLWSVVASESIELFESILIDDLSSERRLLKGDLPEEGCLFWRRGDL
jgi:hypothetical protein